MLPISVRAAGSFQPPPQPQVHPGRSCKVIGSRLPLTRIRMWNAKVPSARRRGSIVPVAFLGINPATFFVKPEIPTRTRRLGNGATAPLSARSEALREGLHVRTGARTPKVAPLVGRIGLSRHHDHRGVRGESGQTFLGPEAWLEGSVLHFARYINRRVPPPPLLRAVPLL